MDALAITYFVLAWAFMILAFMWFFVLEYWRKMADITHDTHFIFSWASPIGFGALMLCAWLFLKKYWSLVE